MQGRIGRGQVAQPAGPQGLEAAAQRLALAGGAGKGQAALPGNDIVRHPGVEGRQLQAVHVLQALCQQLDGITQLLLYLDAGVPAGQALQAELPLLGTRGTGRGGELAAHFQAVATGAAHVQFVPVLCVQVQHDAAGEQLGVEVQGAPQPGLLVHREQQLQGRMGHSGVGHQRQGGGATQAVIGSQGGAVRPQPAILDHQVQRLGGEIVGFVAALDRHHVQVVLDDHHRALFQARRGRHRHRQVAGAVAVPAVARLFSQVDNVLAHRRLLPRGAWNTGELVKVLPNMGGLAGILCRFHAVTCS